MNSAFRNHGDIRRDIRQHGEDGIEVRVETRKVSVVNTDYAGPRL